MDDLGMMENLSGFYKNKSVLITGHTGFKGAWLCAALSRAGAKITGYALPPPADEFSLFSICKMEGVVTSVMGDVRDFSLLMDTFKKSEPEIVFHLAAQPLVQEGYVNPLYTYQTNLMGTVNILECARSVESVKSFLNVTTDKVYKNNEWEWGYRENDFLDGHDPYSNSKSCSELITACYRRSFFSNRGTAISTCRAGNVIGGGDFAKNRIIPDCVRAAKNNETIYVRNPNSVRPYQHVLEPISAYIRLAAKQFLDKSFEGCYNVGSDNEGYISTGKLVEMFCDKWGRGIKWETARQSMPHEANLLKLDCSRINSILGWRPVWDVDMALNKTVDWWRAYLSGIGGGYSLMERQLDEYFTQRVWM